MHASSDKTSALQRVGCNQPGQNFVTSSRTPSTNSPRALSETPRDRVTSALDSPISLNSLYTPLLIAWPTQYPLWPVSHTPTPLSFFQPPGGFLPRLVGPSWQNGRHRRADISFCNNTDSIPRCCQSCPNLTLRLLNGPFMSLKVLLSLSCLKLVVCNALAGSEFSNIYHAAPRHMLECRTDTSVPILFFVYRAIFRQNESSVFGCAGSSQNVLTDCPAILMSRFH